MRTMKAETGSTLALVPAAVLVLVLLMALTLDGAATFIAQRQLADACAAAANDAAVVALDTAELYRSSKRIVDRQRAIELGHARAEPLSVDWGAAIRVRRVGRWTNGEPDRSRQMRRCRSSVAEHTSPPPVGQRPSAVSRPRLRCPPVESAVWMVWLAGVRDLQWRLRRFIIAVGAAALVFAVTLIMTGMRKTVDVEVSTLVERPRRGGIRHHASRPTGRSRRPRRSRPRSTDEIVGPGGATRADPDHRLRAGDHRAQAREHRDHRPRTGWLRHSPGAQRPGRTGGGRGRRRHVARPGLNETFQMSGRTYRVVGRVSGRTLNLGVPVVYIRLADAQAAVFNGQPLATTILTDVVEQSVSAGHADSDRGASPDEDLFRPLKPAARSLSLIRLFLWAVAGAIIGSVIYISVLERTRDLAVFKAVGRTRATSAAALVAQATTLALAAAVLASIVAMLVKPAFPLRITLGASSFASLALVAVVVGLLATLVGLRRAVAIEPNGAFRGP